MELTDSPETLAVWPWKFRLVSTFTLERDTLHHTLTVENTDSEPFSFGIGFHPAFAVPFDSAHKATDYELRFDEMESPLCLETAPKGLVNGKCYYLGRNIRAIPIEAGMFDNDSHCMVNLTSKTLGLYEKGTGRGVVCAIRDFPYCLIWSKPGMPKFVCIEPWNSLPSSEAGGYRWEEKPAAGKKVRRTDHFPWISVVLLAVIVLCCLFAEVLMTKNPTFMDLANYNKAPNGEFLFGTDTMGRDIFSGIWYGGRISITIGFFATVISTAIAVVYGSISGIAPAWLDTLLMRFTEIFLSVPSLLLVLFFQAILGDANVVSLSIVIGVTSWASIAKVIRTEVRQIRSSEYVVASKCMGGSFFHILGKHLAPNFIASIMFMVVMNVRGAIGTESTLSFMGMGLPLEIISWGSMLSLAEKALMTKSWWIIIIPGAFLVTLLMCLTNVGNYLRRNANRKESNL